jgi:hypothetical protein
MKNKKWIFVLLIGMLLLSPLFFPHQVQAQTEDPSATPSPTSVPYLIFANSSSLSGIPGSVVSYQLTIANNTDADGNFAIASITSVSGWTPAPSAEMTDISVPAHNKVSVNVNVPIPTSATAGQNDVEMVSITTPGGSQDFKLTTTVSAPAVPGRPLMSMSSYYLNSGKVAASGTFELAVVLQNTGTGRAYNVVITFDGGTSFYPQGTGGVRNTSGIDANSSFTATQSFLGAGELAWTSVGTIKASVTYSDAAGTAYSDVFTISLNVSAASGSGYYATATPAASNQAQLVVTGYKTDVDILQPGTTFDLSMDVKNMGASDARSVTMVFGGGATSTSGSSTPVAGGVSGSSGELTNFAPLNSSNLVYIGDLKQGASTTLSQKLIVNTSTNPGVYTLKISFVYTNNKGNQVVDDQVITLLVYSLPQVQVDFYRDPGTFQAQMMGTLPLQVNNLGKKSTVLGNMKVTADGADVTNNVSLVGALDSGGYFTLDANITPYQEGPLEIKIEIAYTDDFNQPRTIEQTLKIDVQPAMEITPEPTDASGMPIDVNQSQPETFWQKVGRFFKGLFGLDSGPTQPTGTEAAPTEEPIQSFPVGGGKG